MKKLFILFLICGSIGHRMYGGFMPQPTPFGAGTGILGIIGFGTASGILGKKIKSHKNYKDFLVFRKKIREARNKQEKQEVEKQFSPEQLAGIKKIIGMHIAKTVTTSFTVANSASAAYHLLGLGMPLGRNITNRCKFHKYREQL